VFISLGLYFLYGKSALDGIVYVRKHVALKSLRSMTCDTSLDLLRCQKLTKGRYGH
jgi:hypothetical protein